MIKKSDKMIVTETSYNKIKTMLQQQIIHTTGCFTYTSAWQIIDVFCQQYNIENSFEMVGIKYDKEKSELAMQIYRLSRYGAQSTI